MGELVRPLVSVHHIVLLLPDINVSQVIPLDNIISSPWLDRLQADFATWLKNLDMYQEGARQVDEQRRGVLPTLPQLRQPVRPETERRTAMRDRSDEGCSRSRNVNNNQNRLFFYEFHF